MTVDHPEGRKAGPPRHARPPHPTLRPFVAEIWGMARDLGAMGGFTITPDRHGELLCCPDELFAVEAGIRRRLPFCTLLHLLDGPLRLESSGVVRVCSARVEPWSLGPLKSGRRAPSPSGGAWEDASDLLGPCLPLMERLVAGQRWAEAADLLEQALLDEVGRWHLGAASGELVRPFLEAAPLPTGRLAETRGLTRRQVERRVRASTGTSPKQLAALARFQRARDAIWADPQLDLARLAFEAGYSDQAHLTRSFRRYSGLTPRQFALESSARKAWLQRQMVAFVQDPGSPPT